MGSCGPKYRRPSCWSVVPFPAESSLPPSRLLAEAAAYIMCYLLIEAVYFIGIRKSQWYPSSVVRFLGLLCDSFRQVFLLLDDKKLKFKTEGEDFVPHVCRC